MNSIELVDPESFVQKFDQYMAKIAQGRVIAFCDDTSWHVTEAIDAIKNSKQYDKLYALFNPKINKDTDSTKYGQPCWVPKYGIMITKKCKDPVRAIQFLDWLCTDEAQILNNWGIEGVNYKIENGKRVIPPEEWDARLNGANDYFKKTGIETFCYPFPERGDGVTDQSSQLYVPFDKQTILDQQTAPEKEALKAYGIEFWQQLFPDQKTVPYNTWGAGYLITLPQDSEGNSIKKTVDDITNKSIVKAILAKPGDFDSVWNKYISDLKEANIAELEKEMSQAIEMKSKLFTED